MDYQIEFQETVNKKTLSQEVANQIQNQIEAQSLKLGTSLPSEDAFAKSFGVSRTVIREALKILKAKGLVSIQQGKGTVVSQPNRQYVADIIKLYLKSDVDEKSFIQLYEIREVLECRIAQLAAERRTEEDLNELKSALHNMLQKKSNAMEYTQADLKFHLCLARATHNDLFSMLLMPITELLVEVIYLGHLEPGGAASGIKAHENILRCIEKQDVVNANQIMHQHIEDSRQRIQVHLEKQGKDQSIL